MSSIVFGPYVRAKDGRSHVIHYDTVTRTRRTQSYPRYLMEQKLGRVLLPEEHVDHVNGDPTDDRIENLQVLTQAANNRKSVIQNGREAKLYEFNCPACGVRATTFYRKYRRNQLKLGKAGPYCSKACAGKLHH